MSLKKRYAKTFYARRDLPTPRQEIWPEDTGELLDVLQDPAFDIPLLPLGDAQHVRPAAIGERMFDVVRTQNCRRVLSVDRESKLVRVECGMRWVELQDELRERGLTMERYGLHPATSTIGGLLARAHGSGREQWDGDLRTGCVAVAGATPATGHYGYLPAPRKASGPDMRYLFIGGEGLVGVLLDATLVAWRASEARLFAWQCEAAQAVELHARLTDLGLQIAWAVYTDGSYKAAVFGADPVLRSIDRELKAFAPTHTGGREDVAQLRQKLEAAHPDRRESSASSRTHAITLSNEHVRTAVEALEDASIELWNLTRHKSTIFATYPKGKAPAELPGSIAHLPLASHLVACDEPVHWSHWSQTLKSQLDRSRRLAVGP